MAKRSPNGTLNVEKFQNRFSLRLPPWQQGVQAAVHVWNRTSEGLRPTGVSLPTAVRHSRLTRYFFLRGAISEVLPKAPPAFRRVAALLHRSGLLSHYLILNLYDGSCWIRYRATAMLDAIFDKLFAEEKFASRCEGAAFLRAVAQLYDARYVDYLAINIGNIKKGVWISGHYSNRHIKQLASPQKTAVELHKILGLCEDQSRWHAIHTEASGLSNHRPALGHFWVYALPQLNGESALFSLTLAHQSNETNSSLAKEWTVLGSYFHSHMLRLNGFDASRQMIVSARELDCLRWTAAGKTAWEASKILGISERTVRFHLNTAREKLNCSTTTQAVAKAVARRII
ncbi:MAG: LuxR C-terminal-related transcriptional regulator [Hyphomicrobium sp.]|nr:LuxR C-terminal-related transcriptional regulator [Hyphomicrobium sp.]